MRDMAALSREEIQERAPSIFAVTGQAGLSERYQPYSTSEVINLMEKEAWLPVRAQEQRVLNPERKGYQKHLIRFRHQKDIADLAGGRVEIGREFFEIVLVNSNDGKCSYQISSGIFRLVCLNGAIVGSEAYSMRVKHFGNDPREVLKASLSIAEKAPAVMQLVDAMKGVELTSEEQVAFAKSAYLLKYEENPEKRVEVDSEGNERVVEPISFNPRHLLTPRRSFDAKGSNNLWTTFNIVQENMIKGQKVLANNRRGLRSLRAIKGINEDIRLNKSLWTLSEEMLKLKN